MSGDGKLEAFHAALEDMTEPERLEARCYLLGWIESSVPPAVWFEGIDAAVKFVERTREGVKS